MTNYTVPVRYHPCVRYLENLFFSRALGAVLIANFLALALLNGLRAPVQALLLVYPAALASAWWLLRPVQTRKLRSRPSPLIWALVVSCFLLLTVPRLGYLLEWIPGNAVLAQADDYGRLAELVSMTLSPSFPLLHPGNQDYLLSHYYAAWFPLAFLKLALPLLTLKDCIVAGNLLYHLLALLALVEAALSLFQRAGAVVFLYLVTWFGGLDWVFFFRVPFAHAEHWQRDVFGALREISSLYTVMYWTVHHATAAIAVLLCVLFARNCRYTQPWRKPLLLGLLLASALYSSFFVLLPLPLVAGKEFLELARRLWKTRMIFLLAALAAAPAFLFFGRVDPASLRWNPVSPAGYLLLAVIIDLAGVPLLLLWRRRRLQKWERRWLAGALLFLVSTVALESIGYNNYCMRGMLVPLFVFFGLLARHFGGVSQQAPRLALAAALLFSVATLREAAFLTYQPLANSLWYWTVRGRTPPPEIARQLNPEYPNLARDRSIREYQPNPRDRFGLTKYNSEKLVRGLPVEEMETAEQELARRPLRTPLW